MEEQAKIHDYSFVLNSRKRQRLERQNPPCLNHVYNRTLADSFLRAVKARMLEAKEQYKKELEQYINTQKECVLETEKKINLQQCAVEEAQQDFKTAKDYYESFQLLIKEKFKRIRDITEEAINQDSNKDD